MVDKELELKKIDIVNEIYQMNFNLGGSILSGALVAFLVSIITLFYSIITLYYGTIGKENSLVLAFGAIAVILVIVYGGYIVLKKLNKQNKKFSKLAEEWIMKVEEGKEKLSISEMLKQLEAKDLPNLESDKNRINTSETRRIDYRSLIYGIILSMLVQGAYDVVFYWTIGNAPYEYGAIFAFVVVILIIVAGYLIGKGPKRGIKVEIHNN